MDPLYAFVAANTIGPSTSAMFSMYLGAHYGFRGALPFTLGTSFGFALVLLATAAVISVDASVPDSVILILKALATAYTLWLAWRFMRSAFQPTAGHKTMRYLGFTSGVGQQLSNPRGWVLAAVTLSTFTDLHSQPYREALRASALFAAAGIPVALTWTLLGSRQLSWFEKAKRWLGVLCAGLLAYSAARIW